MRIRAHPGLVVVRARENEVKHACLASCMLDVLDVIHTLLVVGDASITDVVLDGVVEEATILRHDRDARTQIFALDSADVIAIECDLSSNDVVEAIEQPHDGGFATACWPHNSHSFAWLDHEVHILEHHFGVGSVALFVGEADILELEFA